METRSATRWEAADEQSDVGPILRASFAYVLIDSLRRLGLKHSRLEKATCGTIRLKLLKLGARVTLSVRRIKISMASSNPWQNEFALAHARIGGAAP